MRDLYVFGAEYRDLVKLIDAINRARPTYRLCGFIDDRAERAGTSVFGHPIVGDRSCLAGLAASNAVFFSNVCGLVKNARSIAALLEASGGPVVNLVHPAIDLAYTELGRGCILAEGCVVGSGTVIGNYFAARLHAVISHDVRVEDFVFLGPGTVVGSGVHVESGAFIGAGVTVKTGCRIGAHSIVGAGALIGEDVPPGVTIAGVRGRLVSKRGRE